MNRKKIPTIFGILILIFGIVAGIFLINSSQVFKISADVEALPKNVRISNITDVGATITWTSEIESTGFIKWGNSSNSITKVAAEEGSDSNNLKKSFVHSATITESTKDSDIFIKINSNGKDYDNGGLPWQTKTINIVGDTSQNDIKIASGTVLTADGSNPIKSIVYLNIDGLILSGITSDEGTFIIPVSNYVKNINDSIIIEISVNAGQAGTAQAVIYPKAIKAIPTIIIGKTYDFRSLVVNDSENLPQSSLSIPAAVEISSRFEVQKSENQITTAPITLDSIRDGEIITTADPEFFGKGPKNTEIQIAVESELQEVVLTTDAKGAWNWNPPNNLEPGEHKVTLSWKDASGILRTLTRTFVVQASEGPAFEATPSATPLVEDTASPSPTPKSTKTPTATAAPTPETGDIMPTIGLFMIGMGILFSSMYIWNKQDAY